MQSFVGFVIAYAVLVSVVGVGWFLQRHLRSPFVRTIFRERCVRVLLTLMLFAVTAVQVAISNSDYSENSSQMGGNTTTADSSNSLQVPSSGRPGGEGDRSPIGLAFGDGCMIMFGALMLPAVRYSFLSRLLRTSFERLIWLHTIASIGMIVLMVAHWAAMGLSGSGVVVFLASIIAAIPGLLRHFNYKFFRLTHLSVVVAILAVIVHAPKVLIMLLPGLAMWVYDITRRWRHEARFASARVTWHYHPSNQLIELTIERHHKSQPPKPAQFAALIIPDIDLVPHPISIAYYKRGFEEPGPSNVPPPPGASSGAASVEMTMPRSSESEYFTFFIRKTKDDSWTGKLATLAQNSVAPKKPLRIAGIHGELSIPLEKCSHLIFVAGGIGITPWLHVVDSLAAREPSNAAAGSVCVMSVSFLWVGRHKEDVNVIGPQLGARLNQLALRHTTLKFFDTGRPSERSVPVEISEVPLGDGNHLEELQIIQDPPSNSGENNGGFSIICEGRPDIAKEIFAVLSTIRSIDSTSVQEKRIGVFVCGPPALATDVTSSCDKQNILCHSEAFDM